MKKAKQFCSFCGNRTDSKYIEGKNRTYCPSCGSIFYENPLPVASSIVLNENRDVLLVKRKHEPYKDMWCLPIGFAESGEEVSHAALRELNEEAGVSGSIIRLIDVDTVDNDFYGALAIITYEVKSTGKEPRAGDDASEVGFFPLDAIPPLAWSSNEKALKIFIDLYKDSWQMIDSFKQLAPHLFSSYSSPDLSGKTYLKTILVSILEKELSIINSNWKEDVEVAIPSLTDALDFLVSINSTILGSIRNCLEKHVSIPTEEYISLGFSLLEHSVPLHDFFNALALSRKSIWVQVIKKNILYSPIEIYSILELNNKIVFWYDRIFSSIIKGYVKK